MTSFLTAFLSGQTDAAEVPSDGDLAKARRPATANQEILGYLLHWGLCNICCLEVLYYHGVGYQEIFPYSLQRVEMAKDGPTNTLTSTYQLSEKELQNYTPAEPFDSDRPLGTPGPHGWPNLPPRIVIDKVWYASGTFRLLKRVVTSKNWNGEDDRTPMTEIYEEFVYGEDIPDEAFKRPK
jgi:hypothetical protein